MLKYDMDPYLELWLEIIFHSCEEVLMKGYNICMASAIFKQWSRVFMSWLLWHAHRYQWHSQFLSVCQGRSVDGIESPTFRSPDECSVCTYLRPGLCPTFTDSNTKHKSFTETNAHNNLTHKQEMSISIGFFGGIMLP